MGFVGVIAKYRALRGSKWHVRGRKEVVCALYHKRKSGGKQKAPVGRVHLGFKLRVDLPELAQSTPRY